MPSSWPELVERLEPVHGADELAVLVAGEEELVHLVDQRGVVDREDLPEHPSLLPRPPARHGHLEEAGCELLQPEQCEQFLPPRRAGFNTRRKLPSPPLSFRRALAGPALPFLCPSSRIKPVKPSPPLTRGGTPSESVSCRPPSPFRRPRPEGYSRDRVRVTGAAPGRRARPPGRLRGGRGGALRLRRRPEGRALRARGPGSGRALGAAAVPGEAPRPALLPSPGHGRGGGDGGRVRGLGVARWGSPDEFLLAFVNGKVALVVACPDAERAQGEVLRPLRALADRLFRLNAAWRVDEKGRGLFFGRPAARHRGDGAAGE